MNILNLRSLKRVPLFILVVSVMLVMMPSVFAVDASDARIENARTWLVSQQQADGGFEVAGYPGFETADVVIALASIARSGSHSSSDAYDAVSNIKVGSLNALDYLDDLVDGSFTAATAAKIIINVTAPLGLDASDFDPSNDSTDVRDLIGAVHDARLSDGSFGAGVLNTTLSAALSEYLVDGSIPSITIDYIVSTQAADGSFNYAGDVTLPDGGADTTALALEVLIASGRTTGDPVVSSALSYLASSINTDGSISNFGTPDPNSTAALIRGLRAVGIDETSRAWRDAYAPARSSESYGAPSTWLLSQQDADGHFTSPYDSYGVNTLATSQAVTALVGTWFPVRVVLPEVSTTTTTVVPAVLGQTVSRSDDTVVTTQGTLVATGSDSKDMTIVALVIIGVGIVILGVTRLRQRNS